MKTISFLCILILVHAGLYSQGSQKVKINNNIVSLEDINPEFQQIFPDFQVARIYYKNMSPIKCQANYNFLLDEIIFLNEQGEKMALANPQDLSHVIIRDRKFIPSSRGYFEVIEEGPVSLLYKWVCRIKETGREGTHGIGTDAPSIYQMNRISFDAKEWNMDVDKEGAARVEVIPYLKERAKFSMIKGAVSYYKFSRDKSEMIKKYLDSNPVDFKMEADLRRLTQYYNSL